MLEMLGEIIYVFAEDPAGPPQELLEVYTEDVASYPGLDGDWDVVAAFNVSCGTVRGLTAVPGRRSHSRFQALGRPAPDI